MLKRVFYIANNYDGSYFVLSDNLDEYFQRLSAYALNLERSQKTNHYSFGSVEMSEMEYLEKRSECTAFEKERIEKVKHEDSMREKRQHAAKQGDENVDNVIQLFQ